MKVTTILAGAGLVNALDLSGAAFAQLSNDQLTSVTTTLYDKCFAPILAADPSEVSGRSLTAKEGTKCLLDGTFDWTNADIQAAFNNDETEYNNVMTELWTTVGGEPTIELADADGDSGVTSAELEDHLNDFYGNDEGEIELEEGKESSPDDDTDTDTTPSPDYSNEPADLSADVYKACDDASYDHATQLECQAITGYVPTYKQVEDSIPKASKDITDLVQGSYRWMYGLSKYLGEQGDESIYDLSDEDKLYRMRYAMMNPQLLDAVKANNNMPAANMYYLYHKYTNDESFYDASASNNYIAEYQPALWYEKYRESPYVGDHQVNMQDHPTQAEDIERYMIGVGLDTKYYGEIPHQGQWSKGKPNIFWRSLILSRWGHNNLSVEVDNYVISMDNSGDKLRRDNLFAMSVDYYFWNKCHNHDQATTDWKTCMYTYNY